MYNKHTLVLTLSWHSYLRWPGRMVENILRAAVEVLRGSLSAKIEHIDFTSYETTLKE